MDEKTSKAKHGRHAAPTANEIPQIEPMPTGAPAQPTAAMPRPSDGSHDFSASQPFEPASYVSQGYMPATPLMPFEGEDEPRSHGKALKILAIVLGSILALLIIAYAGVAFYFTSHFYPNSSLGNANLSLMSAADAQKVVADEVEGYALSVSGQGFSLKLSAHDAGLDVNEATVVDAMLQGNNVLLWPLELQKQHDESEQLVTTYNNTGLDAAVRTAVDAFNATATQPTNATIAFSDTAAKFVVQPEAVGTALDPTAMVSLVDKSLAALDSTASVTTAQLLQPTVLSSDAKLQAAVTSANKMITADLVLTMEGTPAAEVNAAVISQWVRLDENLAATLDADALSNWVSNLASQLDTVGSTRTYTRPDGKVCTVSGGTWGWEVDEESLQAIVSDGVTKGTVGTIDVPCVATGDAWNGPGAQDWSARYIDIDLAEQHVYMYDASGALIWDTDCISGIPDGIHDTPTGAYYITRKGTNEKLIGYDTDGVTKLYESQVNYWIPFSGNVFALHDATWQPGFGGSMYANGYGSHGCVNLSYSAAETLYGICSVGDAVIVHW